jgi:hypothetical protein
VSSNDESVNQATQATAEIGDSWKNLLRAGLELETGAKSSRKRRPGRAPGASREPAPNGTEQEIGLTDYHHTEREPELRWTDPSARALPTVSQSAQGENLDRGGEKSTDKMQQDREHLERETGSMVRKTAGKKN